MPNTPSHDDTEAFTQALFGRVDPGYHALLWTRSDKTSHWLPADDPAAIAAKATALGEADHDVYVAVSVAAVLPPAGRRHSSRIDSASSAGLVGLWADIDIHAPVAHKKWNLPPDEKSARLLLDACGLEPSLIVHSGHGLQAWWLYPEFLAFDSEDDRLAAAGLAQRWNTTLQVRAAEHGWGVDSTYDLARVMRVPGPSNHKGDAPVPVRLVAISDRRYTTDDFEAHCLDMTHLADRGLMPTRTYQVEGLDLTSAGQPDFERFQAAMANSDIFAATWERRRSRDFADQSASSYDLSLAAQAVMFGWTDQEIANLLIAFRKHHRLDVNKALRQDYMARTIAKARDGQARDEAAEAVEDVAAELDTAKQSGDQDDVRVARRKVLDVIGAQLGITVLHVFKYTSEPPTFRLVTPTHEVDLGGADGILRWDRFRQSVWESIGIQIDRFKPAQWDRLTELVPRAWEEQDIGFEATARGEVHTWLSYYLEDKPPVATVSEAVDSEHPYLGEDGRVVLFGPGLRRYLHIKFGERVTAKELGKRLRGFGALPDKVSVHEPGTAKRSTRQTWILPAEIKG